MGADPTDQPTSTLDEPCDDHPCGLPIDNSGDNPPMKATRKAIPKRKTAVPTERGPDLQYIIYGMASLASMRGFGGFGACLALLFVML